MSFELIPLTRLHAAQAFDLATRVFIERSTLHKALDIGLEEYREYLQEPFLEMVAEELSIVAVDRSNDAVMGCLIVSDFHRHLGPPANVSEKFAPLAALTNGLCRLYEAKRSIGPGQAALIDMGVVSNSCTGRGLYQSMRKLAQDQARDLGFSTVVGELSSASTQHVVLTRLGHRKIAELSFSDFTYAGRTPFRSIDNPSGIVLAEGSL